MNNRGGRVIRCTLNYNELALARQCFYSGKLVLLSDHTYEFKESTLRTTEAILKTAQPGEPIEFPEACWRCFKAVCELGLSRDWPDKLADEDPEILGHVIYAPVYTRSELDWVLRCFALAEASDFARALQTRGYFTGGIRDTRALVSNMRPDVAVIFRGNTRVIFGEFCSQGAILLLAEMLDGLRLSDSASESHRDNCDAAYEVLDRLASLVENSAKHDASAEETVVIRRIRDALDLIWRMACQSVLKKD